MVFLTLLRTAKIRGPDPFWSRRRVFRLTGHLYGRRRNTFRTAIRAMHHILEDVTRGRKYKKQDVKYLWDVRIDSAAQEHSISGHTMREALPRCNIFLNRKVLCDLAIWEPRSFKALTDVAKARAVYDADLTYPTKDKEDLGYFFSKELLRNK